LLHAVGSFVHPKFGNNQTNSERQMYLLKTMAGNTEITPVKIRHRSGNCGWKLSHAIGEDLGVLPVNFQDS